MTRILHSDSTALQASHPSQTSLSSLDSGSSRGRGGLVHFSHHWKASDLWCTLFPRGEQDGEPEEESSSQKMEAAQEKDSVLGHTWKQVSTVVVPPPSNYFTKLCTRVFCLNVCMCVLCTVHA